VLAGHSFGGLYVQTFAATYPDQVAGLVLLDSTVPKPGPALPTRTESYDVLGRISAVFSATAHLGAGRLIAQASYSSLPPHSRGEARANASTASYLRSSIEEFVAANTSMQQAASLTNLDGKPLVVVTADTGNAAGWEQAQDRMAALSTNSSHRVAKDTTHETLLYDETDSAQASRAIHDVIESVRTARPLTRR
jgi:pimeloyl-ACP methyl ester carboxylesterase